MNDVTKKFARSFSRCKGFAHDVQDVFELALHVLGRRATKDCVHRDQGRTLLSQAPWQYIYVHMHEQILMHARINVYIETVEISRVVVHYTDLVSFFSL
jgi:hypothetical protein